MPNPSCSTCNRVMGKAGFVFSGTKKVQRFKCSKCGKSTIVQPKLLITEGGATGQDPLPIKPAE